MAIYQNIYTQTHIYIYIYLCICIFIDKCVHTDILLETT